MDTSGIRIREILPEETYSVRQQILRPRRPLEEVQFEGDNEATTIHLGAFNQDRLVGITTLVKNNHKDFNERDQYQLRGMAVLPAVQKAGVGKQLLWAGETFLKEQRKIRFLWCNARESAVEFYRKNGYQTHGSFFEIPNVCTHIVMFKNL